ncbi:MAG: hypothetical protein J6K55_09170 [Clostridia bacterium]|nr:hypothetical protein [Clostridia bacterium]
MSKSKKITVRVKMDGRTFRRFAMYDTFVKNKRWHSPAIFGSILLTAAIVCFIMNHVDGAVMLGTVLSVIAIGMPAVYVGSFLSSISANIRAQKLPRLVYEVVLSDEEEGVFIRSLGTAKNEHMTLKWSQMHTAHRTKGCIYLYALPTKAFLLPDGQADATPDEIWALLNAKMPKGQETKKKR